MSGRMTKRAREMKEASMTQEQKVASIVHRLCEDNSRAVNGMTPQIAFAIFGDVAMRMMFWLEKLSQAQHGALLKEFAAMLDHIARAELGELTDEEKAELLKMAEEQDVPSPNADANGTADDTDATADLANDADKIIPFTPNPNPAEDSPVDQSAQD